MRSNAKLLRLFKKYNRKYFGNSLKTPVIYFSDLRKRRVPLLGETDKTRIIVYRVSADRKWTEISRRPRIVIDNDLKSPSWGAVLRMTLLHEIVHLKLPCGVGHGPRFHKEMRRLARIGAFEGSW